jgi:thiamine biosynthesis protein ThiI
MKCVALLSSGIDSPVACYSLSKVVDSFIFIHADNRPFTDSREITNAIQIAQRLNDLVEENVTLYIISHGEMLQIINEFVPKRYMCVLCKRMMLRYAEKICEKESADAVIMGDSLGQVASQTLQNIRVVDNAVDVPVLRPLIGWDKEEIIDVAKKIETYNLSILPSGECTAVPQKPATRAKLGKIQELEEEFGYEDLLSDLVEKAKRISGENLHSFNDL